MALDRACMIWDASFVIRPYTSANTSKAVKNAVALYKSLQHYRINVITALKKWEPSQ